MYRRWTIRCFFLAATIAAGVPAECAADREFIYVESNIQSPNGNSIFAFQRSADGTLSQVVGSPFLTQGAGVQDTTIEFGPYDTDQNIVIDKNRRLLYAVNSGSDTIAAFHVNSDGTLTPVSGSPFPAGGEAGGTNPVSLGLSGDILFVVDQSGDPGRPSTVLPLYTAFHIESDGSLTPIAGSTVSVAFRTSPSQALTIPDKKLLFGADFLGGLLQAFQFDSEGHLNQRPPTPLPASEFVNDPSPRAVLGLITHPQLPLLYVGMPTVSRLGVFRFDKHGRLTFVRSVPNSGIAICWLRTNRAGTRLYTTNQGSFTSTSTISVYDITDPETPKEIQSITPSGISNATQIELSLDEQNLFVVSQHFNTITPPNQGKALHVFSIGADGTLKEDVAPITLDVPEGAQPQGIAVIGES